MRSFILSFILLICFINGTFANSFWSFTDTKEQKMDSIIVVDFYKKAGELQKNNSDSARLNILSGLKIAEKIDCKEQRIKGNWLLANLELKQRNRAIADSIFTAILQHPGWVDEATFCAIRIDYAHLLYLEKKIDRAFLIYQSVVPYLKVKNDFKLLVHCYINLSKLMIQKHNFKKAMSYLVDAEKIAKQQQLESKLAIVYGTMGRLYFQEKDYSQSLDCFNQSLFYHTKLNNIKNIAVCHQSIGTLYILKEDFKNAEAELKEAGAYFQKVGYQHQYLTVLNNLGVLYKKQKQYKKAIQNYKETLQLAQQLKNVNMQSTALLNMGVVTALQKNYDRALTYVQQSLKLAVASNETDFSEIYQNMANLYELKGEYKKALKWLARYTQHTDSILNIKKYKAVEDIKLKYESEKKELLIEKISLENDKKQAVILRERLIAGGGGLLFIVVIVFLLIIRRESLLKIESYKRLVAKNEQSRLENERSRAEKWKAPTKNGDSKILLETRKDVLDKLDLLIQQKFYTDIHLTLSSTAKKTDTNSKYLSQIINDRYASHFPNFINQLRLEEAQRLLSDKNLNYLTIEGIAEQAGFRSKSVFNTFFKQVTGVTPSFYREQVQKEEKNS